MSPLAPRGDIELLPSAGDQLDTIIRLTWMTLQNVIVLPVAISEEK